MEEGYRCYVARVGGTSAGYCLFRDDGKHYYLRQLFVARGQRRRRIATALMDWMYANVWSGKPVRLDVFADNEEAVAFYRSYGFRVAVLRMER
jgi:ribosomal protein S18 acetylase RimI-like enzyme